MAQTLRLHPCLCAVLGILLVASAATAQTTREEWERHRVQTDEKLERLRAYAATAVSESSAQPESVTNPVVLTVVKWHTNVFGHQVVIGEVRNTTSFTLSFTKARFSFYTSTGVLVGSDYSYVWGTRNARVAPGVHTTVLGPGETGFFSIWTSLQADLISQYLFTSEGETYASHEPLGDVKLNLPVFLSPNSIGGTDLTAFVTNQSGVTAYFTQVALAGYAGGELNDVTSVYVDGTSVVIPCTGSVTDTGIDPGGNALLDSYFIWPATSIGRYVIQWDEFGVSPAAQSISGVGGTGSLTVIRGCGWTAESNAAWITLLSGKVGFSSEPGTITYTVAANPTSSPRTGTITISGMTYTVTQSGGSIPCSYSLSQLSSSFAATGGPGAINVATASGCAWSVTSNSSFISVSGGSGLGPGVATYEVATNTGTQARSGTITIAGQTVTVSQDGTPGTSGGAPGTNGNLQIHYMNVGQGDGAVLISPQGTVVLFDLGVKNQCGGPLGYLQSLGLTKIDYVIVSHYHSDHIGCAQELMGALPLTNWAIDRGGSYSSTAFSKYIAAVGAKRRTAVVGERITLDAAAGTPVYIDIVGANGNGAATTDEYDLSVVALVRFGDFDAVFGGDIGGAASGTIDPDPNPDPQTLSVSVSGSGTVTSSPGGVTCPGTCSASFAGNTQVTLAPTPAVGWSFTGWSGDCTGAGSCSVAMTSARSVFATFTQTPSLTQTLTVSVSGSGSVTSTPSGVTCPGTCNSTFATNSSVTLIASPATGWTLSTWGGACSGTGSCAVTMATAKTVTATFTQPTYNGYPACTPPYSPKIAACGSQSPTLGCNDNTFSCSQNLSGSCGSGHGGVKCVVCPGPHCPGGFIPTNAVTAGFEAFSWEDDQEGVAKPESYADIESALASKVGQVEVYKVHHHASRYSSETAWMNATRPMVGVVSAGAGNTYGHPTADALARIHSVGTRTYWTSVGNGAVPLTNWDFIGGDIIVEVGQGATRFEIRSNAGVQSYPLWSGGSTPVNPTLDTDSDALPNAWEVTFGVGETSAAGDDGPDGDPDDDGKTNAQERTSGTHPRGFFKRYLAEGATSDFFQTRLTFVNPSVEPAHTWLQFQKGDGTTQAHTLVVPASSRTTLDVGTLPGMAKAEFSTAIESDADIVVDRTMVWDRTGYGSHAETAVRAPATTWYLAEGATHSGFDLFYLVQNPNDAPVNVSVKYLLPVGAPIVKTYPVAARSRFNIWVDTQGPQLENTDVSAVITSTLPVIVERAMYLNSGGQLFGAGHESAGVTELSTQWFLAEGNTGNFFDLFVLIANPNDTPATITAQFLLPDGSSLTRAYPVGANARFNIWVDTVDPKLADTPVSTIITSNVPVIVERAMWWPGPTAATWAEAHNSAGLTETGRSFALADGEVGGDRGTETYILIANRGAADTARVTLYYEDGTSEQRLFTLPASSRTNVAVGFDFPNSKGRRFGAIVEALGSNPQIAVERAMYSNAGGITWAAGTNAVATKLQ